MFSWLKKHFIPHEGNGHRPHILRGASTRNIILLIIFLEIFSFLLPVLAHLNTTGGMAAVLPAVLADLTNEERQAQNLGILTVNPILNKAAEMKAEDMANKGYFAHTSPEGKTPWYWLEQVGYSYQYAGENLAIDFSDSKDVAQAWMASPTHKANIVKENYTEVGTGVANGMYEGHETIFVAQVYANPLPEVFKQIELPKPVVKTEPVRASGEKAVSVVKTEPANILGAEVANTPAANSGTIQNIPLPQPTFWDKLLASPRNTTNMMLYVIFGIIVVALLLYLVIKMRNHHRDLITNGLIVLAIIGAIFIANYYWSQHNMAITQSLDYSNQNK